MPCMIQKWSQIQRFARKSGATPCRREVSQWPMPDGGEAPPAPANIGGRRPASRTAGVNVLCDCVRHATASSMPASPRLARNIRRPAPAISTPSPAASVTLRSAGSCLRQGAAPPRPIPATTRLTSNAAMSPAPKVRTRHSAAAADASHLGVENGVLVDGLIDPFGAVDGGSGRSCDPRGPGRRGAHSRARRLIVVTGELRSGVCERAAIAGLGRSGLGQRADRPEDGSQSQFNSMFDPEMPGHPRRSRPAALRAYQRQVRPSKKCAPGIVAWSPERVWTESQAGNRGS